jgi:hypothetical protein
MIGEILRENRALFDHGPLSSQLRPYQIQTLLDIAACGTAACGLHVQRCDHCGDERIVANTCSNRSCPHCQSGERKAWVEAREGELLPCGYFHVVITLPDELRQLAKAFPLVVLSALMQAAPDAVHCLAGDPQHLGAEVGSVGVLHTWTRDLRWHPHIHLIVTGGGWQEDRQQWVDATPQGSTKRPFLLPVALLRAAFQGRLMRRLLQAFERGEFHRGEDWKAFPMLASKATFRGTLSALREKAWCIRIEPPFGSPQVLLRYLGRYVNRVALAPQRIVGWNKDAGTVTITWTANDDARTTSTLTLPIADFILRFAQHILPPQFRRIRFRGLWSTRHRQTKLARVRSILQQLRPQVLAPTDGVASADGTTSASPPARPDPRACPVCGIGSYRRIPGGARPHRAERHRRLRALTDGGGIVERVGGTQPA